jgi:hypothetical protein
VWLSPVEHCVRDAGVAGSNPATPTKVSQGVLPLFPSAFKVNHSFNHPKPGAGFMRYSR